jgi:hypothetical protein
MPPLQAVCPGRPGREAEVALLPHSSRAYRPRGKRTSSPVQSGQVHPPERTAGLPPSAVHRAETRPPRPGPMEETSHSPDDCHVPTCHVWGQSPYKSGPATSHRPLRERFSNVRVQIRRITPAGTRQLSLAFLLGAGGTSRFPKTPSTGPLRGRALRASLV